MRGLQKAEQSKLMLVLTVYGECVCVFQGPEAGGAGESATSLGQLHSVTLYNLLNLRSLLL